MASGVNACRQSMLALVRDVVEEMARLRFDRVATVDDARQVVAELRWDDADLAAELGMIFQGSRWEFTGCWSAPRHRVRGSRLVKVWRLREVRA